MVVGYVHEAHITNDGRIHSNWNCQMCWSVWNYQHHDDYGDCASDVILRRGRGCWDVQQAIMLPMKQDMMKDVFLPVARKVFA